MKAAAISSLPEPVERVSQPVIELPEPANDVAATEHVSFLGMDFQPMKADEAGASIAREASAEKPFRYVVTPNVDHLVRLEREPALRDLYDRAGMVLNDSRILELLAKFDGLKMPPSPGADIVEFLFRHRLNPDEPVVIIGCSKEDVSAIREMFGLTDIRWHDAPMGLRHNPRAVAQCAAFMAANPARFHFICVGSPQQEMVAWAAAQRGDVKGYGLCCGASLDFLSGKTDRAPAWMRSMRLEWLHRLMSEPRRLAKRYLLDGPAILKIWWKHRQHSETIPQTAS